MNPHPSRFARTLLSGAALLMALGASATRAEKLSPDRQREVLSAALQAFDDAVSKARQDPDQAQARYRDAASGFEALVESGIRNAALEFNLGNTYFRLGRLGEAILHYRRAQRMAPLDSKLAANLAYARERVEPRIEPDGAIQLTRRFFFWHYNSTPTERLWAAALLSTIGWLAVLLWLRRRGATLLVTGVVGVLLGGVAAGSVAWQIHQDAEHPAAVIVGREQTLRLGHGEGYDPALKTPLGPGVEVRVVSRRGDWCEVRLANEQTGWLPATALAEVPTRG